MTAETAWRVVRTGVVLYVPLYAVKVRDLWLAVARRVAKRRRRLTLEVEVTWQVLPRRARRSQLEFVCFGVAHVELRPGGGVAA